MTDRNYLMVQVADSVCGAAGLTLDILRSKRRQRQFARPRQVCMYLMREFTIASFPQIANFINRDHTSVMHGCRVIERLLGRDDDVTRWYQEAKASLLGREPRGRAYRDMPAGGAAFCWGCPEGFEPPRKGEI